jgi:hypothetical protein
MISKARMKPIRSLCLATGNPKDSTIYREKSGLVDLHGGVHVHFCDAPIRTGSVSSLVTIGTFWRCAQSSKLGQRGAKVVAGRTNCVSE